MTEAEPPAPSRLRRRSFFENMEAGGASSSSSSSSSCAPSGAPSGDVAQQDAVSLDLAAAAGGGGEAARPLLGGQEPDAGAVEQAAALSSSGGAPSSLSSSSPSSSAAASSGGHPSAAAAAAMARELLRRARALLAVQLQLWRLQLVARVPALGRGAAALGRQWARCRAAGVWLARRRRGGSELGGGASPVKRWAFPTRWLVLASASLVAAQLLVFWQLQTLPLDLRVDECVFRERLLAASGAREGLALPPPAAASAAALRVLERRFEQQFGFQARSRQRLPWTCMALVPTSAGRAAEELELALARQLAFFWPRAEVVDPRAPVQRASRLQVVLGAAPRAARSGGEHAGVVAALVPLEAFRRDLFPRRFPDLMLVKTEFALRQMVKFRDARAEERAAGTDVAANGPKQANGLADGLVNARRGRIGGGEEDDALSWSQFGVFLLKATVPDVYDRRARKDWDAFLHVVVRSERDKKEQFTEELLALWLAHPRWPTLRVRFASSLALCSSFQLLLSSLAAQQEAETGGEVGAETGQDTREGGEPVADDDEDAWRDALENFDWAAAMAEREQAGGQGARTEGKPRAAAREPNVDLVCDAEANSPQEIARLKNAVGLHVFPVPPEVEAYEELVLESLAAGAVVLTYDSPVMQEWVPDSVGERVGAFEVVAPTRAGERGDDGDAPNEADTQGEDAPAGTATGELRLPVVHVTPSDIEAGVERLLALDRANRVAAGRAARAHYLALRTHYLSAVAALDVAVCDDDGGAEAAGGGLPSEIGAHSRRKVEVETLRTFLY